MGAPTTERTFVGKVTPRVLEVSTAALETADEGDFFALARDVGGFTLSGLQRTWSKKESPNGTWRAILNSGTSGAAYWGLEAFRYSAEGILMAECAALRAANERLRDRISKLEAKLHEHPVSGETHADILRRIVKGN